MYLGFHNAKSTPDLLFYFMRRRNAQLLIQNAGVLAISLQLNAPTARL